MAERCSASVVQWRLVTRRSVAFVVDALLLCVMVRVLEVLGFAMGGMAGGWPGASGERIARILTIAFICFYFGVIEIFSGRTLGKALFGVAVSPDGRKSVRILQRLVRFAVFPGPILLFVVLPPSGTYRILFLAVSIFFLLDGIVYLLDIRAGRALHDRISATSVTLAGMTRGFWQLTAGVAGIVIVFFFGLFLGNRFREGLPAGLSVNQLSYRGAGNEWYSVGIGRRDYLVISYEPGSGHLSWVSLNVRSPTGNTKLSMAYSASDLRWREPFCSVASVGKGVVRRQYYFLANGVRPFLRMVKPKEWQARLRGSWVNIPTEPVSRTVLIGSHRMRLDARTGEFREIKLTRHKLRAADSKKAGVGGR